MRFLLAHRWKLIVGGLLLSLLTSLTFGARLHFAAPRVFTAPQAFAAENCENISCNKDADNYLECIKDKQSCWSQKIDEAQKSEVTLSNTISILNGQISVQELQIEQTQAEISKLERQIQELSTRIEGLNVSLDQLTTVMVKRVGEQYKKRYTNPFLSLISRISLSRAVSEYEYLKRARIQTVDAMHRAESQRQTYDQQRALKEEAQTLLEQKRAQLQAQQNKLTQQRKEQEYLLTETRNNESRYQKELASTLAELEAIQSIIAGRGSETKVKEVNQGDGIASIIPSPSACSTGAHLHFEVVKDSADRDPSGYLKGIDAEWSNQPDGPFGFSGSWEWPVNNAARITQGYGMTYYARVYRAYGGQRHTGIDMVSKDNGNYQVKAVKPGSLYRGSIACGGGTLRYVRVEHKEDGISTYYLHVNY